MKKGWEAKKLGDITTKIGSGATPKGGQSSYKESGISLIRSMNVYDNGFVEKKLAFIDEKQATKLNNVKVEEGDILLNITGASVARCCKVPKEYLPARVNQHVSIIRLRENIVREDFLHYSLISKDNKDRLLGIGEQGSTRQAITKSQIEDFVVYFPSSFEEQKSIIKIIDEAFTAIDEAKANAEKNLRNSRELFDSYLNKVFANQEDGWEEKKLIDVCTLQRGFDLPKRLRKSGQFPLVSSSGIIDTHCEYKVKSPGVVTGRSGSIGNVFHVAKDFWPLNTVLYIKDFHGNDSMFIYHLLKQFGLNKYASGAGVPTLNRNNVHDELIKVPTSIDEQKQIVIDIENLSTHIKSLESLYQQKLADFEELKKSILQKAFEGQL